jgi:hypothetical protein
VKILLEDWDMGCPQPEPRSIHQEKHRQRPLGPLNPHISLDRRCPDCDVEIFFPSRLPFVKLHGFRAGSLDAADKIDSVREQKARPSGRVFFL